MTNAFGVVIDSLNDPNHPIIVHGQKLIRHQASLTDYLKMAVISLAPRLGKALNLSVMGEYTGFFTKLSRDIIAQKRSEYARTKSYAKANSLIEFMLEAEAEVQSTSSAGITEERQSSKCKLSQCIY